MTALSRTYANHRASSIVFNVSGALDRFEQAWHRGVAGRTRTGGVRLAFESLPAKNLTPARWTLLGALKRSGPRQIKERADSFSCVPLKGYV